MGDTVTARCRLCAGPKPYSKLVNLTDERKRQKVLEKLSRLSVEVTSLDSYKDDLPKTVCFPCMDSLDIAFDFVVKVEASQTELRSITLSETIKQEDINNEYNYDSYEEKYDEFPVKEEVDVSEPETDKTAINSINTRNQEDTSPVVEPLSTWKDYNWLCAHCETMFPCIEELKEHSMQYHGCCNPYRCTDCNIRKLNLDGFIKHIKQHRNHLKLSCYKCHMTFSRQYDTIKHKKVHLESNYRCLGCNETFTANRQLIDHCKKYNKNKRMKTVPSELVTNDFTCRYCQKKFKVKGGLTQHLLIHTDRKRDYTCEICGKCFLNRANLTGHMMLHSGSRPHQCEICKHSFRTRSQLRAHIGIHEGHKPFSCDQCGRTFRLKRQLKSHSIIHTDSLPYVCLYCQKGFRFKTILDQHVRQHTGIKPYQCQVCDREFTNWPNYNKHMKGQHNMNMAKRKHTPEGLLPINTTTGEVNLEPETVKTVEWKKKILDDSNRRGRPKTDHIVKKKVTRLKKIES